MAGHDAPAGVRTAAHAPAPAGARPAQSPQGGVKRMHQDTRGVSGSAGTGGTRGDGSLGGSAHAAAAAHAAAPHTGLPPRPRVAPPPINATQLGYKNLAPKGPAAKGREGGELIPTIDPRAGRLLKEAPKAGVPGVTRTPRARGRRRDRAQQPPQGPAIARPAPAPGARRDGRSRGPEEKGAEKHGKQTFQLRSRKRTPSKPVEPVEQVPRSRSRSRRRSR